MTRSDIMEAFATNLRLIAPAADVTVIDESMDLLDFGADSLDLVEAIYRTMEDVHAPASSREVSDVSTVGELVTVLQRAAETLKR
jgi:acyl carrier protein